ncbi:hypothetical protein PanWU01x14_002540 [Parasponia andersonii]|uniref:Uncharacterized protein n=1 Tax=Parasponia andersonii TaxID=3476 RepID=A0A2P5E569_PARAD|nr:hypothetical protein PanWU01x14_002540 [Parasponia andersonii]
MSCAIKCLLVNFIKNRTSVITSLTDDPRERTKRNELCNKMLTSRLHQKSYFGDHVIRRQPEKTCNKQSQGLPIGGRPSPGSTLATDKPKVIRVRVYPLEVDPPQKVP